MAGFIPHHWTVPRDFQGNAKWTKIVCSCVSKFKIVQFYVDLVWVFLEVSAAPAVSVSNETKILWIFFICFPSSFPLFGQKSYWCTFCCGVHIAHIWLVAFVFQWSWVVGWMKWHMFCLYVCRFPTGLVTSVSGIRRTLAKPRRRLTCMRLKLPQPQTVTVIVT